MHNPFRYGVPVSGQYYLARPKLVKKLTPYAVAGQNILLFGPRRFGKTSFLQEYASTLSKKEINVVMIDTYPITSHRDFLHSLIKGLESRKLKPFMKSIREVIDAVFRVRPKITVEADGIGLNFPIPALNDEEIKWAIEDTFKMIGKLNQKKKLAVFFDEFQKIAEINDKGWLEGTIRSEIQKQGDLHYLFCGSRRGLILDMFQNSSKPLYHMATPIELPKFGEEFISWLMKRFNIADIKITKEVTKHLLDLIDWSPNYAQMLAFHLVADSPNGPIKSEDIDKILDNLCQLNGYTYMTLFDSLSSNAKRIVRMNALNPDQSPFQQDLMRDYGLSSSTVQAAIRSLINKRILDDATSKGNLIFDDPLFLRWVQKSFSY